MKTSLSRSRLIAVSAMAMLTLAACTKKEAPSEPAATQTQTAATTAGTPATEAAPAAGAISYDCNAKADTTLNIATDGDNLYFDKKELEAKAGQTVKVEFENKASPASNMNHNWVLTKSGTEQQVATDSMQAGEAKDWVAEGPSVLAHTKLSKPKSTVCVTFTAPAAGDYPYECTFPGHAMTMKGVLHVK